MKNPFALPDDDLRMLLESYTAWCKKSEEDRVYPEEHTKKQIAIKKTLLDKSYLAGISEDDLVRKILEYSKTLEGPATIRIGAPRVTEELVNIKRNLDYLIQSPDDPFDKAARILDGDYKIPVFAKAFWTPILQAQYPEKLPNWNNKTEKFLSKVGINLSTSKLSVKEKYRLLSDALVYLQQLDPSQNFHTLNHLMHYGTVIQEGIDLLDRLIGTRYWQIAPGEGARLWSDFLEHSLAAVGWNELDLDFKDISREELQELYKEKYPNATDMEMKIGTTLLLNFLNLKPGDKIITNKGKSKLLGVGVVTGNYIFRADRKEYRHTVDVDYYKVSEEGVPIPESFQGKFGKTIIPLKKEEFETLEGLFDHKEDISIWWVNQGSTFAAAREGGFLWAPMKSKDGQPVYHWETMAELEAGDIVLHYANGTLRCVSRVKAPAVESKRPEAFSGEEWHEDGRLVSVECHDLAPIILREKFAEALSKLNIVQGPLDTSGGVKQGYLFRLNLDALRIIKDSQPETDWPLFVKKALGDNVGMEEHQLKAWIFQANPKLYDLGGALKSLKELTFEINQHKHDIHVEHKVILWQSGANAGIVAVAKVITEPKVIPMPDFEKPFVRVPERFSKDTERAYVRVERILSQPLLKEALLIHPLLSDLTILKAPLGSNFSLTPEQAAALEALIDPPPVLPDLAAIHAAFSNALRASNISFGSRHDAVVRSLLASLATKRFVILTGLSGSGKTQIAIKFGEWLDSSRLLVVPVRPDWTGSESLFGYEDALQACSEDGRRAWYVPDVLKFLLQAAQDSQNPYLLVLDEMNLAHVERYFADVLSGMESMQPCLPNLISQNGSWRMDPSREEKLPYPRNLFIVGTVNVDETTYMFSPKVLDRANTLEFRVETSDLSGAARKPTPCSPGGEALTRGFRAIAEDDAWHLAHPATHLDTFLEHLRILHELLSEGGFEFGHRVFYEAGRFAAMLEAAGDDNPEHALDLQIMQKVLPRLHGSRKRLEPTLCGIGRFCFDLTFESASKATSSAEQFNPLVPPHGEPKLPISFYKIQRMTRSLRANQFVSFTE